MTAVDREVILRRAAEIRKFVSELERLSDLSREAFLQNAERQYAVMHLLQLAIEASINVGNHIVARKRLGIPETYQDTFSLLEKALVLPHDVAEEMMKMARFRNRLVHVYWQLDLEMIYDIITTKLGDFESFLAHVMAEG